MAGRKGQAMVETIVVLFFFTICFFLTFQFADNLRAKLLCEYAAGRCARAATIGLNDFMVDKTARIATMAAAGPCRTQDDAGRDVGHRSWISRAPDYLECVYEEQARQILDFDYWRDGRTLARAVLAGSKIEATVVQTRPQVFSLPRFLAGDPETPGEARITGTSTIEAHYPDWLQ